MLSPERHDLAPCILGTKAAPPEQEAELERKERASGGQRQATVPRMGNRGVGKVSRPLTRCCMRVSVMLNLREPGWPMSAE